jgi:spore coat protein CotH
MAWDGAMIYLPPGGRDAQVFDQVRVRPRRGGFKVHFYADQLFHEMSSIALINKGPPRWVLSESLSQDLYRRVGAQAPDSEIVRLSMNRRAVGYYVEIEVPNKSFLRRHGRDAGGNLYKLLWAGRTLTQQHKKMTNQRGGHQDLVELVGGLNRCSGAAQWEFIQRNFNVDQMINCYAVGLCIQDWDGFFNNYYAYHDLRPGGKWEVYPWDKDKTWGDYDGAPSAYDWYSMPLTFGSGTRPAGSGIFGGFGGFGGGGPFGGGSQWWRPPGTFSGPLLANPEFRKRFLARLREICETTFTPETMGPVIRGLANRVEPEVAYRAAATGQSPAWALQEFHNDIQSFLNQVVHRREFILQHLTAEKP